MDHLARDVEVVSFETGVYMMGMLLCKRDRDRSLMCLQLMESYHRRAQEQTYHDISKDRGKMR